MKKLWLLVATLTLVFAFSACKPDDTPDPSWDENCGDDVVKQVENGGFETGDLTGWTADGDAFNDDLVTTMETFWPEEIPFGHEGNWHLYGRGFDDAHPESTTGTLTSSTFTLCGDGTISFKLGAARDEESIWVEVRLVDGDRLIAKQTNDEFADFSGVVDPSQAINGIAFVNNYAEYTLDLSDVDGEDYRGQEMYVVLVDNDDNGDFGMINFDDLRTYYVDGEAQPQAAGDAYEKTKEFDCSGVVAPSAYDVINGDFEEGNLCGWTAEGEAFSYKNVTNESLFWGSRPFDQHGSYHMSGFTGAEERAIGTLTSSTFELGGTGWITFLLAGGMSQVDMYLAVYNAADDSEIMRVSNSNFADPDASLNYQQYRLDLSQFLGEDLYLVLVDNATSGPFGAISLDHVVTYHETVPTEGTLSKPAEQVTCDGETLEAPSANDIINGDFESGNICGWSVEAIGDNAQQFINEGVSDAINFWGSRIYGQHGTYFYDGFAVGENKAGALVSSTFLVGGSGWISYQLGGGADPSLTYLAVFDAETDTELVRFPNIHFQDPGTALELLPYRADLSAYMGQSVYLKFVDEDIDGGFATITIDNVQTMHTGVPEGYLALPALPDCSAVTAPTVNDIANGDFETGDLCGWTIDYDFGFAFAHDMVTDATTWWAEEIPYNQEGIYHAQGGTMVLESATGRLVSSTFELGGSGWITFLLGAGKDINTTYILVRNVDTNEVVAVYGNTEFADVGFPNIEDGLRLNNYVAYKADLLAEGASLGDNLVIEVFDLDSDGDWGLINIDGFDTTHEAEPAAGVLAINQKTTTAPDAYSIINGGFETGDLTGWTVSGDALSDLGVTLERSWWNEEISFNKDGLYHLSGWTAEEAALGRITSSTFELGGTGIMTFRLGGNGGTVSIFLEDGTEVARFANSEFADVGFPRIEDGLRLANMVLYQVDLTQFSNLGDILYIEVEDRATSNWGVLFADDFVTYYASVEDVPEDAIVAINIYEEDTVLPVISGTQDHELQTGDDLPDFSAGVTASDNEDGDLTASISIDSSAVDNNTAGVYDVIYTVTDEAGNTATVTIHVTVSDADVTNPVLSDVPEEFFVLQDGTTPDYLHLVSASDNIDGDLSLNITLDDAAVDVATLGSYTIIYTVSDAAGNEATATALVHVVSTLPTVENGGFETGDFTGWTTSDTVFQDGITSEATWWAEEIPYNRDGSYHYSAWESTAGEAGMGSVTSSVFEVMGSGIMTFKLGGNGGYVALFTADGTELTRFYNTEFCDCSFPSIEDGMRLANMVLYRVNLLDYASLGDHLYIQIVDEKDAGWGIMTFDSFVTYYKDATDVPTEAVLVTPHFQPQNLSFESGDLTGWTSSDAVFQEGITSDATWWAEEIPYNREGAYHYSAWNATAGEAGTGSVVSTTFTVGGSGMMTFRLGGNGGYVAIRLADGTEVARFANSEFCDCSFPSIENGMRLANMVQYQVNLLDYVNAGDLIYIEIVDTATSGWGIMTFDAFQTFYADAADVPLDAVIAINTLTP